MMDQKQHCSATIKDDDLANIQITLSGRLDIYTTASIWQTCLDWQAKYKPNNLIINTKSIDYCDGAGIALLQELKIRQSQINKQCSIQHLKPQIQNLLDMAAEHPIETNKPLRRHYNNITAHIGYFTVNIVTELQKNVAFLGELSCQLFHALLHPKSIRWKDMWFTIEDVGPHALPIIALIGFLVGLISAFQSAVPLGQFGAQIYIAKLVSIGLVKEMGPLMTAVLLAGRTASSFSAEIGTMKINQEVDALSTMGLNPLTFLIVPRVIATTLMTPLLSIFLVFFGLVGCGIVMHTLGFPLSIYIQQLKASISITQITSSLIKTLVFGVLIASIGCYHGLKTKMGPSAVGESTTQAVVSSIIMIVIVDGIFALIFYALGI